MALQMRGDSSLAMSRRRMSSLEMGRADVMSAGLVGYRPWSSVLHCPVRVQVRNHHARNGDRLCEARCAIQSANAGRAHSAPWRYENRSPVPSGAPDGLDLSSVLVHSVQMRSVCFWVSGVARPWGCWGRCSTAICASHSASSFGEEFIFEARSPRTVSVGGQNGMAQLTALRR